MNKFLSLFSFLIFTFASQAQTNNDKNIADSIVAKAMAINELESTSWIANDSIMAKIGFDKTRIEGYLSYKSENTKTCIFYNSADSVLAELHIKDNLTPEVIYEKRPANQMELRLININRSVKNAVANKTIKNFKIAKGTTYNYIPLIWGNENYCYMINAVSSESKIILGRDYKIKLDENYKITDARCNHKSIQDISLNSKNVTIMYHSHTLLDNFSETEIATLLLYKKYLPFDQFGVISKKQIYIWNNTAMTLTTR